MPAYYEANRDAAKMHMQDAKEAAALAALKGRGVLGSDCVLGGNLTVGADTTIKKSTIGTVSGVQHTCYLAFLDIFQAVHSAADSLTGMQNRR